MVVDFSLDDYLMQCQELQPEKEVPNESVKYADSIQMGLRRLQEACLAKHQQTTLDDLPKFVNVIAEQMGDQRHDRLLLTLIEHMKDGGHLSQRVKVVTLQFFTQMLKKSRQAMDDAESSDLSEVCGPPGAASCARVVLWEWLRPQRVGTGPGTVWYTLQRANRRRVPSNDGRRPSSRRRLPPNRFRVSSTPTMRPLFPFMQSLSPSDLCPLNRELPMPNSPHPPPPCHPLLPPSPLPPSLLAGRSAESSGKPPCSPPGVL